MCVLPCGLSTPSHSHTLFLSPSLCVSLSFTEHCPRQMWSTPCRCQGPLGPTAFRMRFMNKLPIPITTYRERGRERKEERAEPAPQQRTISNWTRSLNKLKNRRKRVRWGLSGDYTIFDHSSEGQLNSAFGSCWAGNKSCQLLSKFPLFCCCFCFYFCSLFRLCSNCNKARPIWMLFTWAFRPFPRTTIKCSLAKTSVWQS